MLDSSRVETPDDAMVEVLRRMTAGERLAVVNGMWVSAHNANRQILRSEHPDWSEQQLHQEICRRMLHGVV